MEPGLDAPSLLLRPDSQSVARGGGGGCTVEEIMAMMVIWSNWSGRHLVLAIQLRGLADATGARATSILGTRNWPCARWWWQEYRRHAAEDIIRAVDFSPLSRCG